MLDLKIKDISYKDIREKNYEIIDDRYGMAQFLTDHLCRTFLASPNIKNDTNTFALLLLDGDTVVGREIRFWTRVKVDNDIIWAKTGCDLEVCEEYRKIGAGIMFLTYDSIQEDAVSLGAFYSPIKTKMLKKQKRVVFEIPEFIKLNNTRFLFESLWGVKGTLLRVLSALGNTVLRVLEIPNFIKRRKLLKKYEIKKEKNVPEWAGEMATNDGHKYMEYHDTKWLQWNLDYNMNGYPEDIQSFYSIYDKKGIPMGFFMTKERYEDAPGKYKNVIRGTIVEWGSTNNNILSEAELNLLAISTFSPKASHITAVTVDSTTKKQLIKMGFRNHGTFRMGFKDNNKKEYPDGQDQSLWRIRFGCCNSIII